MDNKMRAGAKVLLYGAAAALCQALATGLQHGANWRAIVSGAAAGVVGYLLRSPLHGPGDTPAQ